MSTYVDVIICTPGWNLTQPYMGSLIETFSLLSKEGITWAYSNQYSSLVHSAREATADGGFQHSLNDSRPMRGELSYNKMFWIDSDMQWDPQDFLKLYKSDYDMVSGAYILSHGMVAAFKEEGKRGYSPEDIEKMSEPEEIVSSGFGFLAIRSGVFESLERPWFGSINECVIIDGKEYNVPIVAEDTSFCYRARRAGFKIFLDPTVRPNHYKTMPLGWPNER